MAIDKTLYNRLGGKVIFEKVHKLFYDRVYDHSWLGKYFAEKPQEILESQQTDFMVQLMGGPKIYAGKAPKFAHQHMVITDELYELRSQMLSQAIKDSGVPDDLRAEWMAADAALKRSIVKESAADCTLAYAIQPILDFKKQ